MAFELSEIQLLDDDQLFTKLREFDVDVGPVVDSTRSFYQLMLLNKLNESEAPHDSNGFVEEASEKDVKTKKVERSRRSVSKPPPEEPKIRVPQVLSGPDVPSPFVFKANPSPHIFERWTDDEPYEEKLFGDAITYRSRASVSAQSPVRAYDSPLVPSQSSKKGGSILKTVFLLGFVFVLAAFIILVVAQSRDPYNNIETEANSLAGDVSAGV